VTAGADTVRRGRTPSDGGAARQTDNIEALRLTAAITHEGEWYVAHCLQVEVSSRGETSERSLENLREALELSFEDAPAPEVTEVITAPVEVRRGA
jgi:predicted RNase H-like HicB family nuclease